MLCGAPLPPAVRGTSIPSPDAGPHRLHSPGLRSSPPQLSPSSEAEHMSSGLRGPGEPAQLPMTPPSPAQAGCGLPCKSLSWLRVLHRGDQPWGTERLRSQVARRMYTSGHSTLSTLPPGKLAQAGTEKPGLNSQCKQGAGKTRTGGVCSSKFTRLSGCMGPLLASCCSVCNSKQIQRGPAHVACLPGSLLMA